MRFGVNYTPSAGWFHSWLDFDPRAVRRDLEAIAGLGVDHIRLMPLWPHVQPNRGLIRPRALEDVVTVVDVAAECGLDVNVDGLQGHLSSFDFVPAWLSSWHRRNMFTDPDVVTSTAHYLRRLTAAVADRPNLLGVTIGNEVNQFAAAPHPFPHPVTEEGAGVWLSRLTAAIRDEVRGSALVTHAMYDAAWYDDTQPFGPAHAVAHGDETVVHSWVFNGAAQTHGGMGAGSVRHAEYLCRLAAAWHTDAARPVWLQEVGAPTNVVAEQDAPDFLEATLRHVARIPELSGITWWCSHDVSRDLLDFPELEYDLGLIASDGRVKPTGERFATTIEQIRKQSHTVEQSVALVLDDTEPGYRAASGPTREFYRSWLELAGDGAGPQIVLASRAGDTGLLTARGITDLRRPTERR
ncbi:glycosyl hydrolase [Actinoplanes sp. NPDC049596]|uniref:glycoside hydrolase 5 family protein n=1 Tax=unclassified Actinoplanes TaxID=2626549 RepID=UPI003431E86B